METVLRILKIFLGVVSCVLAVGFCLPVVGFVLVLLTMPHFNSVEIGDWTFSGWQIFTLAGVFAALTVAFAYLGLYAFRSSRTFA
jgi:hypothetical protein